MILPTRAFDLLGPHHADAFQTLASDPAVTAMTRLPHPFPPGAARDYIESKIEERERDASWWFAVTDCDRFVGSCGVFGLERGEPEVGFWIGRPYWGRGYATFGLERVLDFAFRNLGLARVAANALEGNAASRRVLVKRGMRYLGTSPQLDPLPDRPQEPVARYDLTRDAWQEFCNATAISALHPLLTAILAAELAAGNEIAETGGGWPDDDSVFVRVRDPFLTRPDPLPEGVAYSEPKDPHWWKADYSTTASPRHLLIC